MARTTIQGSFLGLASQAAGDVMYFDGTNWIRLAKGSADEVLTMNDGATAPGWEVAGGGATAREGGNTTGVGSPGWTSSDVEATTTSTNVVDLISATNLTIAGPQPFKFFILGRKTSGAADNASLGYKVNATIINEALAAARNPYGTSTTDRAEDGHGMVNVAPRVTNYQYSAVGLQLNQVSADDGQVSSGLSALTSQAKHPTVEITSLTMRGITDNALNTLGADELQVYSWASS